jgi:hypothetical protein
VGTSGPTLLCTCKTATTHRWNRVEYRRLHLMRNVVPAVVCAFVTIGLCAHDLPAAQSSASGLAKVNDAIIAMRRNLRLRALDLLIDRVISKAAHC